MRRRHIPILFGGGEYDPVQQLGSDLIAYWDADSRYWGSFGGMTDVGSGKLSSWRDNVAGYNMVQATDSLRPVFSATAFNGGPGVSFDGVNHRISCSDAALQTALTPISGAAGSELFAVYSQDATDAMANICAVISYGLSNTQTRGIGRSQFGGESRFRLTVSDGALNEQIGLIDVNNNGRGVAWAQFNPNGDDLHYGYWNGVLGITSTTTVLATATNSASLGCISNGARLLLGVLVGALYCKPLTTAKRDPLHNWLMSRRRP